ncbi:MAG: efflux RND transporter periplasmic adaptor subunit [Alphaproteobacteria bacterium]|nr:efflux RND transporter periplasmic adaptor subunit [Alphaproteobacteria bacterium]
MNKKLKWIIGILIVILIIVIVIIKKNNKKEGILVTTERVELKTIIETVNASGKLFPEIEVKVSPDVSGEIIDLMVEEGDSVRAGMVLARIFPDIYKSQRDQVLAAVSAGRAQVSNDQASLKGFEATLTNSKNIYERQKKLFDEKVISRAELDNAKQAYDVAQSNYNSALQTISSSQANLVGIEAQLTRANKDLSRTTLLCPMNGVVSLLNVKKGERVVGTAQFTGTEMMRIAELNNIEVRVDVGENDIVKVKIGDTALIQIDAFPNRKFKGLVHKIANPNTASSTESAAATDVTNYKVHARLIHSDYADLIGKGKRFPFRPNMTVDVDIQTQIKNNVIAVPLSAVTTRESKGNTNLITGSNLEEVVFVVPKGNYLKKVAVKTGIQDINNIEILSGLTLGDSIVTGPYLEVSKILQDSSFVRVEKDLSKIGAQKVKE